MLFTYMYDVNSSALYDYPKEDCRTPSSKGCADNTLEGDSKTKQT